MFLPSPLPPAQKTSDLRLQHPLACMTHCRLLQMAATDIHPAMQLARDLEAAETRFYLALRGAGRMQGMPLLTIAKTLKCANDASLQLAGQPAPTGELQAAACEDLADHLRSWAAVNH